MTATDRLADADLKPIGDRLALATAMLDGNLEPDWDDPRGAEAALGYLIRDDVPRLLVELEQRGVDYDTGYVTGLHKAVGWLKWLGSDPGSTGLDAPTMARIVAGAEAMAQSAATRLGVDAEVTR